MPSTPDVEQVAPPSILLFSILPRTVVPGGSATLCISADHAQQLFVTGVGAFNPKLTSCRTVSPETTTTFLAYATNKRGQQAKRTITLVVLEQ